MSLLENLIFCSRWITRSNAIRSCNLHRNLHWCHPWVIPGQNGDRAKARGQEKPWRWPPQLHQSRRYREYAKEHDRCGIKASSIRYSSEVCGFARRWYIRLQRPVGAEGTISLCSKLPCSVMSRVHYACMPRVLMFTAAGQSFASTLDAALRVIVEVNKTLLISRCAKWARNDIEPSMWKSTKKPNRAIFL